MIAPSQLIQYREFAAPDPRAVLAALAPLPHPFLLHSALSGARGRWSFFGADPFAVFGPDRYAEAVEYWRRQRDALTVGAALDGRDDAPPFIGGLVGCWSYDFGRRLERLPTAADDDLRWPDVWLAAYDVVGAIDHAGGRAWLISSGLPATPAERPARAAERLGDFARRLEAPAAGKRAPLRARAPSAARSTFTPDAYRAAVARVRDHIARGDIFQANLSQRWTVPTSPGAAAAAVARQLFEALADVSPAPFAAYLDLGGRAVASASPERFLELRGSRVESRPIKGTRARGTDADADAVNRAALLASAKDRAENVMIVDVLRNDLGRVCETGSVSVPELCALETFPQVFHLTSTVTGTLRAGRDAVDLLHACFPGGSITGAPKIRAMEVIESLEPFRRSLYTGAIGYLDWRGDADWNIAIRTALVTRGAIHFSAGGGITADSEPEAEYRETLAKAEGMRQALAVLGIAVELAPPESEPGHEAARGPLSESRA